MKKYDNFFYISLEKKSEVGSEDELDQEENNELDYGSEDMSKDGSEDISKDGSEYVLKDGSEDVLKDGSENGSENRSENRSEDDLFSDDNNEINIKITKLKLELQEKPEQKEDNIFIEFKDDKNLEKIQDEYIKKIINLNKNITVTFIIPEILIRTRALTFYKCWRNGYCLNASTKNIPKNITKILFKKK